MAENHLSISTNMGFFNVGIMGQDTSGYIYKIN